MEISRLARNGTAKPVSRDQILRRKRAQGIIHYPCSADHEQDWQPYLVDPYSCYMCGHHYSSMSSSNSEDQETNTSLLGAPKVVITPLHIIIIDRLCHLAFGGRRHVKPSAATPTEIFLRVPLLKDTKHLQLPRAPCS